MRRLLLRVLLALSPRDDVSAEVGDVLRDWFTLTFCQSIRVRIGSEESRPRQLLLQGFLLLRLARDAQRLTSINVRARTPGESKHYRVRVAFFVNAGHFTFLDSDRWRQPRRSSPTQ